MLGFERLVQRNAQLSQGYLLIEPIFSDVHFLLDQEFLSLILIEKLGIGK